MTNKELILAASIHIVIPLAGLILFLLLVKKMKREDTQKAPIVELFIIFATYGGLLLVGLTTILWQWSAMASLGTFYLILIAPILLGIIAYRFRQTRSISKYHNWTYLAGIGYFIIAPISIVLFSLFD